MGWFTRFSRFGDMHFVFAQEKGMTCGPSSTLMCYTKIKKLAPGAQLYGSTKKFKDLYAEWNGSPYDGSTDGTWPEGLVYALNKMGCGKWQKTTVVGNNAADKILSLVNKTSGFGPTIDVKPVIVGINWDGSTASHWVVIDTIRSFGGSTYATVCDPWDGGLHIQKIKAGGNFVYEAGDTFHVDFGPSSDFSYSTSSKGRVSAWPIIHLT